MDDHGRQVRMDFIVPTVKLSFLSLSVFPCFPSEFGHSILKKGTCHV